MTFTKVCPACGGNGYVPDSDGEQTGYRDCEVCDSQGAVPEEGLDSSVDIKRLDDVRTANAIRRSDDNSYVTLVKHQKTIHVDHSTKTLSVGGDEITAELQLSEDDVSLIRYLLVNASEMKDEVDAANDYEYLLEHIAKEDVDSLLSRINELEAAPSHALTEAP